MPSAVIVGAGVFGSSLARQLAVEGWDVTLVEQESPGWDRSSSGGESRLVRFAHGSDAWYAHSAQRALELWNEIDPELVSQRGLAWFAHGDDGWEADSERMLRDVGIPVERLEPGEAGRLYPSLGGDDLAWVLYEPTAGFISASRAVGVLVEQAREAGAQLVRARAEPAAGRVHAPGGESAVCFAGEILEADRIVWASGPWLAKLFPGLVELRPTLQEVLFFDTPPEWQGTPGWVDYDRSLYGHGPGGGFGFKAATDAEGQTIDPDDPGDLDAATEPRIRAYLGERFPALADAPLRSHRPCPYELTPDTHFIAGPHPEHEHVWLLGGGSGHGFKHGPALAERMSRWLRGDEPPEPRFAVGPREVDRSLRTAGVRATPMAQRPAGES